MGSSTAKLGERELGREPELARRPPGRDVGVSVRLDTRVEAHGYPAGGAERGGFLSDQVELSGRLDVQRANARREGRPDLLAALPDTREDDLSCRNPGAERLEQLSAGDDVGAEPVVGSDPEHCERVVRLDRVADDVRCAREQSLEQRRPRSERLRVVDVERRPDVSRDLREDLHAQAGVKRFRASASAAATSPGPGARRAATLSEAVPGAEKVRPRTLAATSS